MEEWFHWARGHIKMALSSKNDGFGCVLEQSERYLPEMVAITLRKLSSLIGLAGC